MDQYSIRNEQVVQDAVTRACMRGETLILDTSYLHFEAQFAGVDQGEVHVRAGMSMEEALYGLHGSRLRIRFPHGLHFLEAQTQMLGFGTWNGENTIRLRMPSSMEDDDHRGTYRAEPESPILLAFRVAQTGMQEGVLGNISTTGAKICLMDGDAVLGAKVGEEAYVSLQLAPGLSVESLAMVRYAAGRSMGVEFDPPLPEAILTPLARWIFRKREADRERQNRLSLGEVAGTPREAHKARCLMLLSDDFTVEKNLRPLLKELPLMVRVGADLKSLKEALDLNPALVFLHLPDETSETQDRLVSLAGLLEGHWPFLILGTGVDNAALFETGAKLHSSGNFMLGAAPGPFFPRLVQGILRRHQG